MSDIRKTRVANGVFWVEARPADLRVLCGCPADSVKHLIRRGLTVTREQDGVTYDTGPNAILLSDVLLQGGRFANLAEFPVLQLLYKQGMLLPGHPRNTGEKPLLLVAKTDWYTIDSIEKGSRYITRFNLPRLMYETPGLCPFVTR